MSDTCPLTGTSCASEFLPPAASGSSSPKDAFIVAEGGVSYRDAGLWNDA
ncbi:hypothetical protein [Arthrobacter sp. Marseille-P9274]|nr:hypothetical protein [Arthrobacter sp. Marseille-P9274]